MTKEQEQNIIDRLENIETEINNIDYPMPYNTDCLWAIHDDLLRIGAGTIGDGCLERISRELHQLNKNFIIALLLHSNVKNPELLLEKYSDFADKFLERKGIKA